MTKRGQSGREPTRPGSENRGQSRRRPATRGQSKRRAGAKRKPPAAPDPSDVDDAELRYVQPYEATKSYLCPGCNREIPAGTGHLVAVPPLDPDLRRHWHRGCWNNRRNRY